MLERLLERGKTSGREDDNAESIKKRFRASRRHFSGRSLTCRTQKPTKMIPCLSSNITKHWERLQR